MAKRLGHTQGPTSGFSASPEWKDTTLLQDLPSESTARYAMSQTGWSESLVAAFRTHDIKPVDWDRKQNLRNWESKGRQYNPITGVYLLANPDSI